MNIFVLDLDPILAAEYQGDKHVVKMVLESAQLLCSPYDPGVAPYKRTHYNHPCAKWTRESLANWKWLLKHAYALSAEYSFRYNKTHKCHAILDWLDSNPPSLPEGPMTPFAQAMPEQYKNPDPVVAYRAYYCGAKRDIVRWNKTRTQPFWYI